ncbi:MAG: AAA family ATPase [candidate division Zixibacteria bacterium]|nr:AAA family ATPase [candidate division Zixibacteria bacterium]
MNWTEKYRPQTFDEVVGQDEIVKTIRGMLDHDGDIPNIRMIGEPGTGKTTVAYLIGEALLKEFFSMNFIEFNASNDRGVETIRDVIKSSKHQPLFSSVKVIFLDESDGLTPAAQNMLRKPLENRKAMRYILSANDDMFIKAIRSRCVVFEFKPVPIAAIQERLEYIADKENLNLNGEIEEIARKCGGDMRMAINELQRYAHSGSSDVAALLESVRNMDTEAV